MKTKFDITKFDSYRENNRLEVKRANYEWGYSNRVCDLICLMKEKGF